MKTRDGKLPKISRKTDRITPDKVVGLRFRIVDESTGHLLQYGDELVYLHGGYGGAFPKVERAMEGRSVGDHIELTLAPEEGYGHHRSDLVLVLTKPLGRRHWVGDGGCHTLESSQLVVDVGLQLEGEGSVGIPGEGDGVPGELQLLDEEFSLLLRGPVTPVPVFQEKAANGPQCSRWNECLFSRRGEITVPEMQACRTLPALYTGVL